METCPLSPQNPLNRPAQMFPTLSASQLNKAEEYAGKRYKLPANQILLGLGDREGWFIILQGAVVIEVTGFDSSQFLEVGLCEAGQFIGEAATLSRAPSLMQYRSTTPCEVLFFSYQQMAQLLANESDIADLVLRAFELRRQALIRNEQGGIFINTPDPDLPEAFRIRQFLSKFDLPFRLRIVPPNTPPTLIANGKEYLTPTTEEMKRIFALSIPPESTEVFDLIIIGGGPSGISAAVYASSEGIKTLVVEKEHVGGQASTSSRIENYLGFPQGISGQGLMNAAHLQAMKFGTQFLIGHEVTHMRKDERGYWCLELDVGCEVCGKTILVASGACYRGFSAENLEQYMDGHVHYSATGVEGALCKGKRVVIVGGGNSAGQAATFLAQTAERVTVVIRRTSLYETMSLYLIHRIENNPNIALKTESEIKTLHGSAGHLQEVKTDEETILADHLFLMVGAVPNTQWMPKYQTNLLDIDGFIITFNGFHTELDGVFAVGDVRAGSTKRVASGVGEGSIVVSQIHQYLSSIRE